MYCSWTGNTTFLGQLPYIAGHSLRYSFIFRRNNVIHMEMTFSNKALSAMQGFAIQLNKNSFGLTPTQPLNIPILNANQTLGNNLIFTQISYKVLYGCSFYWLLYPLQLSIAYCLGIRIRWIRKILASEIRLRKNMRIHGEKYCLNNPNKQQKKWNFFFCLKKSVNYEFFNLFDLILITTNTNAIFVFLESE